MMPDLQASLLCDDVRQERNGKFILIGLFDGLSLPSLPFVMPRLCLVNRWCCGRGAFEQHSRIVRPDGQGAVAEGKVIPLSLPEEGRLATSVEYFVNVRFVDEGIHWVEVLLGRQLKLRYPLHVRLVRRESAPPADS